MDTLAYILIGVSAGICIGSSREWQRFIPLGLIVGIYLLFTYIVPSYCEAYSGYIGGAVFVALGLLIVAADRHKRPRIYK